MKYVRNTVTILLFLILIFNSSEIVLAVESGFSTETLSDDEENTVLGNINISMLYSEPEKKEIECFDVNESGMIALGSSVLNKKIIAVYSTDGIFQYGYQFNCSGSFGVEWDEDKIIIYLVRSNIAIIISTEDNVEDVLEIQDTIENNSYWNHFVFSNKRIVGDCEYSIKNNMGVFNIAASSYSQLVVTNSIGETNIIYDVSSSRLTKNVTMLIGGFLFICIVLIALLLRLNKVKAKI